MSCLKNSKFLRVNFSFCYFRTALILAVNYESTNIVRLLLQQDIDAFAQDMHGRTADEYARSKGFLK